MSKYKAGKSQTTPATTTNTSMITGLPMLVRLYSREISFAATAEYMWLRKSGSGVAYILCDHKIHRFTFIPKGKGIDFPKERDLQTLIGHGAHKTLAVVIMRKLTSLVPPAPREELLRMEEPALALA